MINLGRNLFKFHRLSSDFVPLTTTLTRNQGLDYFEKMVTMRQMEISCDTEYKAKQIRGFCHLYDGQEAVAMGIQAALNDHDNWITSYRCHCIGYLRGLTVEQILGELLGRNNGATGGRGGSMHFYNKSKNFYGGQGIVGAQVPVGTGLAFADWYIRQDKDPMPVSIVAYGDGAANQGQIWESMNLAALHKLPTIFCIENNMYGMGTSIERSSCNPNYYTMGNVIPGIQVDGMDVLAVREATKAAKNYASQGNGPILLECKTYRYHGHSMSDPGTTYRDREEVMSMRKTRDPIQHLKQILMELQFANKDELLQIEKTVKKDVKQSLENAKNSELPHPDTLYDKVYVQRLDLE